ncbi:hypothetical protein ILUMI_27399 [Ignelater luminosus]|uniref:beta-N-acetylhexosaminidase n=1 Tax=Ignelater luminosus TaxID=2038154 RepID=A0A8K0FWX9_IGNLU|nr:hypothetical protein ILUMI_27399 [Ignelater luminosus]
MVLLLSSLFFVIYLGFITLLSRIPSLPVEPTKGAVWPKPQIQVSSNNFYFVRPQTLKFHAVGKNCQLLEKAFERYLQIINKSTISPFEDSAQDNEIFRADGKLTPYLDTLNVFKLGAYTSLHVYSPSDVNNIISYAAERGIRVIAEFDTPGHTASWGKAIPELLTRCYTNGVPNGKYGPIDPTKDSTYSFFENFFDEVTKVFPDEYLHLGADEVPFDCWESNPDIKAFMEENNIESSKQLEDYYIQKLLNISHNLTKKAIVWEEAFTDGVQLSSSTIVQIWKDWVIGGWQWTTYKATNAGFPVLLSACWYLDYLVSGGDWRKFYDCEPLSFIGNDQQKALVLGGEACMWTESVNEYNIEPRVWPRASAVAEKLWSAENADTYNEAAKRLEEHTCRMNKRGIEAQPPNGPGFCI